MNVFLSLLFLWGLHLNMNKAVELALENNPSMRAEYTLKRRQKFQFARTLSGLIPSPTLNVSYSDAETEVPLTGPGLPGGFSRLEKGYTVNFNINQVIFDPSQFYGILADYDALKGIKYEEEEKIRSFVLSVKEKYINCLKAQKLLKARKKAMERAEENYKLVETKYNLGSANELELLEARVSKTRAHLEYEKAKRSYELAKSELLNVMGIERGEELILEDVEKIQRPEVPPLEELLKIALELRGSVIKAELERRDKRAGFIKTLFTFLPSIKFGWYYTYSSENFPHLADLKNESTRRSGIFASLSFNFNNYPFDIMLKKQEENLSYWQLKSVLLSIREEVEKARVSLINALRELELAELLREQSERSLELAKLQYKLGSIGLIQYLDAEEKAIEGEISYYEAYYSLFLAKERLNASVGREVIK